MTDSDLEDEARQLRDRIYGEPISNESWENIKKNWMRPDSIVWLREHGLPLVICDTKYG